MRMQSTRISAASVIAMDGSGRISAVMVPIAAIAARPTNGWRGALSNFISFGVLAYQRRGAQASIYLRSTLYVKICVFCKERRSLVRRRGDLEIASP